MKDFIAGLFVLAAFVVFFVALWATFHNVEPMRVLCMFVASHGLNKIGAAISSTDYGD